MNKSLVLSAVIVAAALVACGKKEEAPAPVAAPAVVEAAKDAAVAATGAASAATDAASAATGAAVATTDAASAVVDATKK
jgi:hypothetical protein